MPKLNEEAIFNVGRLIESPEARRLYLQQTCGDDVALQARVEALLRVHERDQGFLQTPAEGLSVKIDDPVFTERPGTRIGPYKLLEQIGEGGMGLVFVAEQTQPVRRKVALKLIKPGMDSRQVIARFEAERQALAIMDHPNIAKIHDGGTTSGEPGSVSAGRPYFVMELVKGKPITAYCDQHQLPTRQRLELFADVCQAVQHAHQKGIIHRDLKPSNVLVEVHDVKPVVKIIDFGIAKAVGQQLTDKTMYTGIAQMIGTPLYMSPEQAGLSSLDVDTRSDVYSLGVLLYELLTGSTPFDGEALKKAGYDEMRRIVREDEPPKPSARLSTMHDQMLSTLAEQRGMEPRKLSQHLRGELDCVVMKALEKDRNRRYESASALAADVQRYLQDEPVLACPPSRRYRLGKFLRKNRTGVLTTAAVLTTVMVLGGGIGWVALDRVERRAETDRMRATTEQAVAGDLREADNLQRQDQWGKALQALERAAARLEGSGLTLLQATVTERQGEVALIALLEDAQLKAAPLSPGRYERGKDYVGANRAYAAAFAKFGLDVAALPAEESAQRIQDSAIRNQLVEALDYWAYIKDRLPDDDGAPLRAIAQLADVNPWRQKLRDPKVATNREALERLAEQEGVLNQPPANLLILSYLLDKAKAPAAGVRLLRRAQQRYPTHFWLNFELALQLAYKPETAADAVGFFRAALVLQPESPVVYLNLGNALGHQGLEKEPEAEAACRKAIELKPDYATAYNYLGNGLINQKKFPEAIAAFRKAIELQPDYVTAYSNLGNALHDQQKFFEAEAAYRKAIELKPGSFEDYFNLGIALRDQQKFFEAEAACHKAIELQPDSFEAYSNLGTALQDQQKFFEAEAAYRKAIELKPGSFENYFNLGTALRDQQKFFEAEAANRKAIELKPDSFEAYGNLSQALLGLHKLAEAEAACRKAIELRPDYFVAYGNLSAVFLEQKKLPEAIAACRKVIEIKPDSFEAYGNLIQALLGLHKLAEAEAVCRKAIELDPKKARVYSLLGYVLAHNQKFSEAIAAARKAVDLDPLDIEVRYDAACVAAQVGCAQGKDVAPPDDKERARYRGQALAWLRAALTTKQKELAKEPTKAWLTVRPMMERWQKDSDFNAVRGDEALAELPEAERQEWRKLWEDVEELRKCAETPQPR